MDTDAIASEIVYLKNRIAQLGDESAEERDRLHERLRKLRNRLGEGSSEDPEPDSPADEVRYIPPA